MRIVTLNTLAKSIQRKLQITDEEAYRYATIVLELFGYDDRIIDNILEPKDRRLFYLLQLQGLLTTHREDAVLCDGRTWRIHYWMFQKQAIFESEPKKQAKILSRKTKSTPTSSHAQVYTTLPEQVWATRKIQTCKYPY